MGLAQLRRGDFRQPQEADLSRFDEFAHRADRLDVELGRDDDAIAVRAEEGANEFLVLAVAIPVRGIEQGHAQIERASQRGKGFRIVLRAVIAGGHGHAADPGCRQPGRFRPA
jgi:hypothetical protein